ncbi:ZMYM1 protein, partial [Polyodon spathula]|nr:ZMYM1 protein [Polyodon spathula]
YSVALHTAFCFACWHFAHVGQSGHPETAFTHDGFRNWKKASISLKTHDTAAPHTYSVQSWAEFKLGKEKGSRVQNVINFGHSEVVEENRRYMRAVVELLCFTVCQNITQCAHREDEQSYNKGNFLERLHQLIRNVQTIQIFFFVTDIFSGSVVHDLFIQKQKELKPTIQPVELKKLSDTRWACQHAACWAIQKHIGSYMCNMRESPLCLTKTMSDHQQSPSMQVASAIDLLILVISALKDKCNEETWEDTCNILKGVSALNTKHESFLDKQCALLELSTMLQPYRDVFIDLYKIVCIALTLPVSSAACEHVPIIIN